MASPGVSVSTQSSSSTLSPPGAAAAAGTAAVACTVAGMAERADGKGVERARGGGAGSAAGRAGAGAGAGSAALPQHGTGKGPGDKAVGAVVSAAERASGRLNSFGPFHGSANCLEEMRAQSPPRPPSGPSSMGAASSSALASGAASRAAEAQATADAAEHAQRQYDAWRADHPSALEGFEQFIRLVNGRRLAVFLDYDGTLSPIVEDPDRAVMSPGMREVVRELAGHFPTAIISGRGREKVYNFVQLSELFYAGSHGMDIMMPLSLSSSSLAALPASCPAPSWHRDVAHKAQDGPASAPLTSNGTGAVGAEPLHGGAPEDPSTSEPSCETCSSDANGHDVILFQPAKKYEPLMEKVYSELQERAKGVAGACIENNNFCLTIHFRRVQEELWDELADIVADVVRKYPSLRTTHGRKVLEIRPQLEWNKGKAVSYLLHTLGLTDCAEVMPIYIGDDRTDEDAFLVLKERGNGCGIVVAARAKSTVATFSLRDPSEVMDFLHKLVRWKEEQEKNHGRPGEISDMV